MITWFVGQILEVKSVERQNKETRQKEYKTEITAMFDGVDVDGYRVPSIENAQLPDHFLDVLTSAKGKFVAIGYKTINTKNGTYTFPDDVMEPIVFDKSPLHVDNIKAK